jgi:REDY-like protein HapK
MPVKFVITTLKPGVRPGDYEWWVRERDYAFTQRYPNFVSYRVHRIEGAISGAPPGAAWHYVERIEVKSLEQHQKDLASPEGAQLLKELYDKYLDRGKNIYLTAEVVT